MIYPATLDITILQNSTFRTVFRALENKQTIEGLTVSGGAPFFNVDCHGLTAGDKVVIVPSGVAQAQFPSTSAPSPIEVPCGLELNRVYFVISSGLTSNAFTVSATSSGSAIAVTGSGLEAGACVAAPVDLTGYTADADLKGLIDNAQVATFTCSLVTAADGLVSVAMTPATTSGLETGNYGWDVSLTSSGGERYYWLTGTATVQRTFSRN